MTTVQTAHATSAREAARTSTGRFGVQPQAESGVDLGLDVPDNTASTGAAPAPDRPVYVMSAEDFTERFAPGEYDLNFGWEGTEDHPSFSEPNPFNPERIHAGTWDDFVADIAANGIREPVEIDPYSDECSGGHHRVVAALQTGQPVRFTVADSFDGSDLDLTEELADGSVTVEAPAQTEQSSLVDPGPPPITTGTSWERDVSPYTGLVSYNRTFEVRDGEATHNVSGLLPDEGVKTDGQARVLGDGGIVISQKGRMPGEMHYKILDAPLLDAKGAETGERAKAIYVNWVEVERNRGKGWATAMYAAVREAHPDCIVPAAANLEAPGKRLVKHYRDKHPQTHAGRFDTDYRIHPTTDSEDKTYKTAMLKGPSWQG